MHAVSFHRVLNAREFQILFLRLIRDLVTWTLELEMSNRADSPFEPRAWCTTSIELDRRHLYGRRIDAV
jgi:hypothetical protein